jgi:thiamine-monophosphate kinase
VISEARLIDRFLAPFDRGTRVAIGPGSDCAAIEVARGQKLVSTTDALVEGAHFDWRWFTPAQVGHKALAVNLSDLAAAGAQPRWFLCAVGMPPSGAARLSGIARGMARLAARHGCALIGGNFTASKEWSITITALGEAPRPRSRIGARKGDSLFVNGVLGAATAGLASLRAGARQAVKAQLTPVPLVEAGLAARGLATAAIDVSDGFLRDLLRLCDASGVGVEVDCDALPIGPGATLDQALSGGEDYALLFSVPPRHRRAFRGVEVGRFVQGRGVKLFQNGQPRALPRSIGFDHFA